MWVPKWYWEAKTRQIDELERRVKRLELMMLQDAKNKIASLSDNEAGEIFKDGVKPIEQIAKEDCRRIEAFVANFING